MADKDDEVSRQEEARDNAKAELERRRENNPTLGGWDVDDPSLGWTVQQGPAPAGVAPVPGYVVQPHELPDPAVQVAHGIDPAQANAGVPVGADADEVLKMRGVDLDARKDARARAAKAVDATPGETDFSDAEVKDEAVGKTDGDKLAAAKS